MRSIILFACLMACVGVKGQALIVHRLTAFKQYEPATVHFTTGKSLKIKEANVFLKNSQLLYKSDGKVKQAFLDNVKGVDFASRSYVKIDSILAYHVESVAQNALYCSPRIDMEAYNANILNSRVVTNVEIGSQVSLMTLDPDADEYQEYPIQNHYYFLYNGKYVEARKLSRVLPKEKRRMYWTIVRDPGFSWTHEESLLWLLESITR